LDKPEKHKEIELEVTGPNSFSPKDNKVAGEEISVH